MRPISKKRRDKADPLARTDQSSPRPATTLPPPRSRPSVLELALDSAFRMRLMNIAGTFRTSPELRQ